MTDDSFTAEQIEAAMTAAPEKLPPAPDFPPLTDDFFENAIVSHSHAGSATVLDGVFSLFTFRM
ncbi:hypothetical protein AGMMS49545_07970 [Betaproteobacteria bacterium]|nr:hypothetical protein AGMMS49545_07970 [Betaproteobacteria bacterium]GHU42805.1 hypothetical protein AGMMS50289_08150 [Betaproteobacteria bacterium]